MAFFLRDTYGAQILSTFRNERGTLPGANRLLLGVCPKTTRSPIPEITSGLGEPVNWALKRAHFRLESGFGFRFRGFPTDTAYETTQAPDTGAFAQMMAWVVWPASLQLPVRGQYRSMEIELDHLWREPVESTKKNPVAGLMAERYGKWITEDWYCCPSVYDTL